MESEGENKVVSLPEAVARYVRPGMTVHAGNDANALLWQLLRQFWGQKAQFTMVIAVLQGFGFNLIHGGLVKKVITSNCSDVFLTPGPSPIVQRAYKEGRVEFENWSLYTHLQRLMAAALGLPFLPTTSLVNSTMQAENSASFATIPNPFDEREGVAVVKALAPDISLVHAWAADAYGNCIPMFGDAESVWGAKASTLGAIVSAENVVSTDFLRRYAPMVKIPGHIVKAVVHVPFGAHPSGMSNPILEGMEAYQHDASFLADLRAASREPQSLDAWLKEWVLDSDSHEKYLDKLGSQRLTSLKGWVSDGPSTARKAFTPSTSDYSPVEMMVVAAARKIKEHIRQKGYRILLTGIGTAGLAAWMAYYWLRHDGYLVDLLVGSGYYGYTPRPGSPNMFDVANEMTSKMVTDSLDVYGVLMKEGSSMAALGAGQVDKFGNVNSTKLTQDLYLTGSGGGNDAASTAGELMVIAPQSARRFLDQVFYVTMPGQRVKSVVSTLGIFEKLNGAQELSLTAYFPTTKGATEAEKMQDIQANCGWRLKVADKLQQISPPTSDELGMLRALDPKKEFLG